MDTSNPSVFVNAELLRLYVGRQVRAVIQVVQSDPGIVIGKSTDDIQFNLLGHLAFCAYSCAGSDRLSFFFLTCWQDMHAYNQLCQLANGEFKTLVHLSCNKHLLETGKC
ncbi:hypothetical protein M0R45_029806 [Rubus argutus]|uniref:Uncharacterized protein n=1 Tax=Rubus argutus TaxID=59490 RepID=A0AAW1WBC5_RUBAR